MLDKLGNITMRANSRDEAEENPSNANIGGYALDDLSRRYKEVKKLNLRLQEAIQTADKVVTVKPNGRWLDYGCGWGVFLWHVARLCPDWTFVGVDADEESIEIHDEVFSTPNVSVEKRPYDYYLSLPENSYDVISFMEVLEHVANPGEVLRSFRRALKEDGLLILTTPNALGWNYLNIEIRRLINKYLGRRTNASYLKLVKARKYNPATEEGHICQFSIETLERMLRISGFEVISFTHTHQKNSLMGRIFKDGLMVIARKR